jgi:hypothetical protein
LFTLAASATIRIALTAVNASEAPSAFARTPDRSRFSDAEALIVRSSEKMLLAWLAPVPLAIASSNSSAKL